MGDEKEVLSEIEVLNENIVNNLRSPEVVNHEEWAAFIPKV